MRTTLRIGIIGVLGAGFSLGACGGVGPVETGSGVSGQASTLLAPEVTVITSCKGIAPRAAGEQITVEDLRHDAMVLVRSNGVPLCTDTLEGVGSSGVLDVVPANHPTSPSSSDPMPAHGGGDTQGGGGGGGGTSGGGTTGGGGEGNSDPMPADDTRRN